MVVVRVRERKSVRREGGLVKGRSEEEVRGRGRELVSRGEKRGRRK